MFTGNYASNNGGAIAASGTVGGVPGVVAILNSTFSSNSARDGGAIDSSHNLTVTGSTFSGNYGASPSVGGGGAINSSSSSLVVTNSTFSGNSGPFGGAISTSYGSLAILNSTITGNSASRGGGLEVSSSAVSAENAIIAGNTATSGPDVYGAVTSLGHNLVGNTAGSSGFGATGDLLGADPLLGPLANNGGPTWTHALLTGSPAIDAANTAAAPATDQRGIARYNSVADIGAFEWSPGAQISGTVFSDPNANGLRDTGEPGVPDWTVYLDENGNGQYDGDSTAAGSYSSTNVPVTIIGSGHTSTLAIPGGVGTIADVNITLNITHTWDSDLEVDLVGPDGTRVNLFANVGGSGDNFTNTTLDDEAPIPITSGSPPFSGSYRPAQSLASFDGKRASGVWTLEITDTYPSGDNGQLNSWSLALTTVVPGEPTRFTDASGNYTFSDLSAGTYTVGEVQRSGWVQTAPSAGTYTLIADAGEVISGRDFGNKQLPTQSTTILPSADGYVTDDNQDGTFTLLDITSQRIRTDYYPAGVFIYPAEDRGLFEFDLSSISASATVVSATLKLTPWEYTPGAPPTVHFFAYSGDGVVSLADATAVGIDQGSKTIADFISVWGLTRLSFNRSSAPGPILKLPTGCFVGNGRYRLQFEFTLPTDWRPQLTLKRSAAASPRQQMERHRRRRRRARANRQLSGWKPASTSARTEPQQQHRAAGDDQRQRRHVSPTSRRLRGRRTHEERLGADLSHFPPRRSTSQIDVQLAPGSPPASSRSF